MQQKLRTPVAPQYTLFVFSSSGVISGVRLLI